MEKLFKFLTYPMYTFDNGLKIKAYTLVLLGLVILFW